MLLLQYLLGCALQGDFPESRTGATVATPAMDCEPLDLSSKHVVWWHKATGGDYPYLDQSAIGVVKSCHRDMLLEALAHDETCAVAHLLLLQHSDKIPDDVRRLRTVGSMRWGIGGRRGNPGTFCAEGYDFEQLWSDVRIRPHFRRFHGDVHQLPRSSGARATEGGRARDW